MASVQEVYAKAIAEHGSAKVARITKLCRTTVLSIASGNAREGTRLVAEQRAELLSLLSARQGD